MDADRYVEHDAMSGSWGRFAGMVGPGSREYRGGMATARCPHCGTQMELVRQTQPRPGRSEVAEAGTELVEMCPNPDCPRSDSDRAPTGS